MREPKKCGVEYFTLNNIKNGISGNGDGGKRVGYDGVCESCCSVKYED